MTSFAMCRYLGNRSLEILIMSCLLSSLINNFLHLKCVSLLFFFSLVSSALFRFIFPFLIFLMEGSSASPSPLTEWIKHWNYTILLHIWRLLFPKSTILLPKLLEDDSHAANTNDNFQLLAWWKENSPRYPILSRIAKDVCAVAASTVASEYAFSLGKRILDPFRSSLTPKMVEALVCMSDLLRAGGFSFYKEPTKAELEPYDELEKLESGIISFCFSACPLFIYVLLHFFTSFLDFCAYLWSLYADLDLWEFTTEFGCYLFLF